MPDAKGFGLMVPGSIGVQGLVALGDGTGWKPVSRGLGGSGAGVGAVLRGLGQCCGESAGQLCFPCGLRLPDGAERRSSL